MPDGPNRSTISRMPYDPTLSDDEVYYARLEQAKEEFEQALDDSRNVFRFFNMLLLFGIVTAALFLAIKTLIVDGLSFRIVVSTIFFLAIFLRMSGYLGHIAYYYTYIPSLRFLYFIGLYGWYRRYNWFGLMVILIEVAFLTAFTVSVYTMGRLLVSAAAPAAIEEFVKPNKSEQGGG